MTCSLNTLPQKAVLWWAENVFSTVYLSWSLRYGKWFTFFNVLPWTIIAKRHYCDGEDSLFCWGLSPIHSYASNDLSTWLWIWDIYKHHLHIAIVNKIGVDLVWNGGNKDWTAGNLLEVRYSIALRKTEKRVVEPAYTVISFGVDSLVRNMALSFGRYKMETFLRQSTLVWLHCSSPWLKCSDKGIYSDWCCTLHFIAVVA